MNQYLTHRQYLFLIGSSALLILKKINHIYLEYLILYGNKWGKHLNSKRKNNWPFFVSTLNGVKIYFLSPVDKNLRFEIAISLSRSNMGKKHRRNEKLMNIFVKILFYSNKKKYLGLCHKIYLSSSLWEIFYEKRP
jgi:hypothetical protein